MHTRQSQTRPNTTGVPRFIIRWSQTVPVLEKEHESRLVYIAPPAIARAYSAITRYTLLSQDGDTAKVGITAFAAKALGDVVYVQLPDVGDTFTAG